MAEVKKKNPAAVGDIKGVYVISSEDAYLGAQECEKLLAELLPEAERATGLYEPEANKADCREILDELRTLPFLASRRVVLIKNAESFLEIEANTELLEKYIANPSKTGSLILAVAKLDGRKKFSKLLGQNPQCRVIVIEPVKSWDMPKYAAQYAQLKHQVHLSPGCAEMVIEYAGLEPGSVTSEIDKLVMYKYPARTITVADVEELIGQNRIFNPFDAIDCIAQGDAGKAFLRLRRMFESDKDVQYKAVGAIAFHFRRLFKARAMLDKGQPEQTVVNQMGLAKNFTRKQQFMTQVKRFTLPQLGKIMYDLAWMDYQSKNGQAEIPASMEKLFVHLASVLCVSKR